MLKFLTILVILVINEPILSQTKEKVTSGNFQQVSYKEGSYETLEAFKTQSPTETTHVIVSTQDGIAHRFIDTNSKKIKKPAVIVKDGVPYFNIVSIFKNFDKDSKGQGYDGGKYFLKAETINGQLIMKDFFTSSMSGLAGGMIGSAAARREKVIVFISKDSKFHLFKNFKKFEEYINKNYPDKVNLFQAIPDDTETEADKIIYILKNL